MERDRGGGREGGRERGRERGRAHLARKRQPLLLTPRNRLQVSASDLRVLAVDEAHGTDHLKGQMMA